ncbi:hypothetical protein BsWGS_06913 [Bradybaena similaris]
MPRGGGAGGRGGKKSHKGQRRHFTDEDELREQAQKAEKEKAWRRQQGIESDEEEEVDKEDEAVAEARVKNRDLPPSESESGTDSEEEDEEGKPKGVAHLIEIENPNRAAGKSSKKVSEIGESAAGSGLSRREREELEKQEARRRYQALHLAGKTEEAQADLARLAIIRKQREEAAKKREEERLAKEAAKEAASKTKGKS